MASDTSIFGLLAIRRWALSNRNVFYFYAVIALFAWVVLLGGTTWAWVRLAPVIWHWGAGSALQFLGAAVAYLLMLVLPPIFLLFVLQLSGYVASLGVARDEARIRHAQQNLRDTEEAALRKLDKSDEAGLLPLLRYSRAQLEAYYEIGLSQTRRSFRNAVIAMWLGFLLLAMGVFLYVGPAERLGLQRPGPDFNILIVSSAVIVEMISALFLWIYRSTTGQLTYYYRLQMRSHTSILCFRIASSMEESDGAKRAIIDSILDSTLAPERPPPAETAGLRSLMRSPAQSTSS
jgi:hypothetical protein